MRVAFLIRSLSPGGAERQLVTLAKGLRAEGHYVSVAAFYPGGYMGNDLAEAAIPVFPLGKKGRWDVAGFIARLAGFLRREKPDILYSFVVIENIVAGFLKPFFPGIRNVWGVQASNMDLSRYDALSRFSYWLEPRLAVFSDLVIVNSKAGFDHAASKGFPRGKMRVIHNGIDTERFRPDEEERRRVRREWGIGDAEKLVGLAARLVIMKDHRTFIRAAAVAAGRRRDVRFVCIGGGKERYAGELREAGRSLGLDKLLIWAGERQDMPSVYNALDIAVSSSYSEGLPNAVGEAMACGIPCVVTDAGDSALIVGDTGVVVPPRDPDALADGILTLLKLLEKSGPSPSRGARARIEAGFSVDRLISDTSRAFRELL